ncbi:MAG TPA: PEGA domain-containing protein [Polyangiaceae bacterium]|nr:PEGA domain-containing protein [Polyangiaceae bacterium]
MSLALTVGIGGARADAPGASEASAHFQRGLSLADSGDLDRAIAEFEIAHRTSPHPDVLFNLAQAYSAVGRSVDATRALEQYLASGTGQNSKRRKQAESLLRFNQGRIGTLVLEVRPPGAVIAVDGAEIGPAPLAAQPVLLAGTHAVTITLEGYQPAIRSVLIPGGGTTPVSIELEPQPKAQAEPAASAAPSPAAPLRAAVAPRANAHDVPEPSRVRPTIALVSAIGGGLFIAGGVTLFALNSGRYSAWQRDRAALDAELNSAPASANLLSRNNELSERALGIQRVDDVALGVGLFGGALLAGGAALWLTSPKAPAPAVHVAIGKSSLTVHGSF